MENIGKVLAAEIKKQKQTAFSSRKKAGTKKGGLLIFLPTWLTAGKTVTTGRLVP